MNIAIWIVTYLFLWASGVPVTTAFRIGGGDRLVRMAMQFAFGFSLWPIVFLLTTKAGLVWTPSLMRIAVIATIALGLTLALRRKPRHLKPALPFLATFALLALLAIATRANHIRNLAFPGWVDGVHHAMIVRLLLEHGAVPPTVDPYIPGAPLGYHWGFHVPAAFVAATTGNLAHSDMPTFLLHFGQALNALTLLIVYAAGRVLLRSRAGGMFAAVLAVFVSTFPAFYLSWGRYSHLAGTLVLPPLLIALWRGTRSPRWLIPTIILTAGLVLIHVRIALFAMLFAVLLLAAMRARRTALLRWSLAALLAIVIVSPWVYDLSSHTRLAQHITPSDVAGVPAHVVNWMRNRELLGVVGILAIVAGFLRRRIPWRPLALLSAWILVVTVVLHWRPAGIDLTSFASYDSAVITMFLPLSLAGGALLARLAPRHAPAIALLIAIAGALAMRAPVNRQTVLAEEADLRAMRWIERNVPRDALFAVDAHPWLSPAWVGTDGGYWIGVATGRRTILPPLLYAWSLPRERVDAINTLLATWSPATPGITHIYIGTRGDAAKRRALLADPRVRVVYRDGGVTIFALSSRP